METKTIEQLKVDADAAQRALDAAETAAAEAARAAARAAAAEKARAENAIRYVKQLAIAEAVAKATGGVIEEPRENDRGGLYQLPRVRCGTVIVSLEAQYVGSNAWRAGRWTGGYVLSIDYKYKTLPGKYFPLKTGGYNYEKLAVRVGELNATEAMAQKARTEKTKAAASAEELVVALREELGLDKYTSMIASERYVTDQHRRGGGSATRYVPDAGKVFFRLDTQLTPAQVKVVYAALVAAREVK